ncbi:Protein of unknown function [Propionibacterium freudenreichii]|nr:Protein of unknown function [Propionibacterium freudenreichii subsp. freudenreichii]CEG87052.1 Protein of unknown function [Propionibacterium freudenreichii]CEG94581.1 Protein of unknown function [Propionibacterium freudenreichii]CEG99357.1 Protein of unknown function [Propionibacterium freudenreichii]CEH01615.1 Protein of unknown function [Propionibacterium freudenreichii]
MTGRARRATVSTLISWPSVNRAASG